MPTIIDIADKLHLSKSTVSRALTGSVGVSEKTKKLVKQTAKELNYSVNKVAQNLAKKRTYTIGFMIPDISDDYYPKMAIAVENVLEKAGYTVSYCNVQRSKARAYKFLETAEGYKWDGIFITPDCWDERLCEKLNRMEIPIISLRRKVPLGLSKKIPTVDSDRKEAVERGMNFLISLKHNVIAFIGFDTLVGNESIDSYKKFMNKNNLEACFIANEFYQDSSMRIQQGYSATRQLMDIKPNITAIFTCSDDLALGALQYFKERNIRVPQDVSVLGYDNRDFSGLYCIQLSSLSHQVECIGESAAKLMLELLSGKNEYKDIFIPAVLVERRTTAELKE